MGWRESRHSGRWGWAGGRHELGSWAKAVPRLFLPPLSPSSHPRSRPRVVLIDRPGHRELMHGSLGDTCPSEKERLSSQTVKVWEIFLIIHTVFQESWQNLGMEQGLGPLVTLVQELPLTPGMSFFFYFLKLLPVVLSLIQKETIIFLSSPGNFQWPPKKTINKHCMKEETRPNT